MPVELIYPSVSDIKALQFFHEGGAVEVEKFCRAVFDTAAHFQCLEQKVSFHAEDVVIEVDAFLRQKH